MDRRKFLQRSLLSTIWLWLSGQAHAATQEKPNILWLTSEDHGPHLGCYGDLYADTPNLDKLAARGMLFKRAWSTAPVCAAARTALISGIYPPSLGAEHMRSLVSLPAFMKMYPQYLREAGYYCSNNAKEDYNLVEPGQVWDDSSGDAHWRNRGSGQPFFSVFNFGMTHESQIRAADANTVHELAGVRVPAYQPDTPEVRSNWAQYYDRITQLDSAVAEALSALEQARLSEDTIVFFFSDHGSGFPRSKRWPFNSGLHVPMIVYFPDKWRHLAPAEYAPGAQSERLVDFMDLAPTLLSLIGTEPPAYLHGHAFAGGFQSKPPDYLYAFRGRMDERYDMVRTVTDGRYIYLRHYMPHKIYGQHVSYMFETQATQVWKRMFDEGRLNAAQSRFWEPKPPEEFLDECDELEQLLRSNNVTVCKVAGFEADDVLGTLSDKASKAGMNSLIYTCDLDLLQVLDENTEVEVFSQYRETRTFDVASATRRFNGIGPLNIPDLKALMGDRSDNLPGVPGIGERSATAILAETRDIETMYADLEQVARLPIRGSKRIFRILSEHKDDAFLMKRLATIVRDVPIDIDVSGADVRSFDLEALETA
mgnify:CR=1 FL=1